MQRGQGPQRPTRVPAEHGRRLGTFATGDLAGRARLDEQHVPPLGEGNFNNSTSFAATGVLQADHIGRPPSAPASPSPRSSGSAPARSSRRSRVRSSTSAASSRGAASSSTTTCPDSRPARTRSASTTNGWIWSRPPAGPTCRRRQPRPAAAVDGHDTTFAAVNPTQRVYRPVHLRLHQRQHANYDHVLVVPTWRQGWRRGPATNLTARRLEGHQGRRSREHGPDRRRGSTRS